MMTTAALGDVEVSPDPQIQLRREVVSRQLAEQLVRLRDRGALRVLDVGCGASTPALLLARAGHLVTGVSTDTDALTALHGELSLEPTEVQGRLRLVEGDGAEAGRHFPPGSFDLAICHDVLEDLPESDGMLAALSRILTQGGLVSVTSRNAGAVAMRPGCAGEWTATRKALAAASFQGGPRTDTTAQLATVLADLGAPVVATYGVEVFSALRDSDFLPEPGTKSWQNLVACEEEAGRTEPYRSIAATVHLVGEKTVR